ncbi:nuclear receptor sub 2, group F, member 2 [Parelaphostrongylus tenuis]|uniref:Nuclear receptor sub 2, group F, member 2 n=1 Tax=Parelaphostrongylus tenuis TaxID=148309 RepID=A0AAD5MJ08_PARTN|nr:nuclear receptor sub 2, group F, member 2 [Parelaphostrongylus tenuis]
MFFCESQTSSSPPVSSSSNSDGVVVDCVVCGDKSSGKHYGQFSCEGWLKKEILDESLSFHLLRNVNSAVLAVQQGRIHNGQPFLNCFFPPTIIPRPPLPFFHPFMLNFTTASDTFSQITDTENNTVPAAPVTPIYGPRCPTARDIGTYFLYTTVDWVKQLPFFNMLSQHDQATLLQYNWVQLFILCAAGVSAPLTFKDELNVKEGNTYMEHVERLRAMHMDLFEMSSMKAIVLFNSDTPSLQDVLKVEAIQEKVQTSLDEYCRAQKSHQPGRFGRLLLRLPILRAVNSLTIEALFFSTLDTPIQMVLKELLNRSVVIPKFWPYSVFPHFPVNPLT